MRRKRLLTIEDLVQFCSSHQLSSFDSHDEGYSICVQVPATFTEEKKDDDEDGLIAYGEIKILHVGENRNGSVVTMDAAKKCLKKIAYTPILASFATVDGVEDFTSHDLEIDEGENGEDVIVFNEKQVGSITADKAEIRHDDENGKDYLVGRAAIPKTYTHAADIIARKDGTTKVSAELKINAFSKDKDGVLTFNDIDLLGVTLLGTDPETKEPVSEGMEGAKLTLDSFSVKNNSGVSYADKTDEIFNLLHSIDTKLNAMNEKGGKSMSDNKITELLAAYGKTAEDITFDTEGKTDEELEALFAENFSANNDGNVSTEGAGATGTPDDGTHDGTHDGTEGAGTDAGTPATFEGQQPQVNTDVEIIKAARQKVWALNDAVNKKYIDEGLYYDVTVFKDYVIEHTYTPTGDKFYKESYVEGTADDGSVAYDLPDARTEVFMTLLSTEEMEAANASRVEFAALKQYKEDNEKAKRDEAVKAEFAKFDSVLAGDADYEALKADNEGMDINEIDEKLNTLVGKKAMFSYSQKDNKENQFIPFDYQHTTVDKPYGGLFG